MGKKMYTKRTDARSDAPAPVNVMKILAEPHPVDGEDYAIHLWYKAHGHNPRFTVTEKSFDRSDNETATLVVNGERWQVNIRKCTFLKVG
jgi:hypothetical protein